MANTDTNDASEKRGPISKRDWINAAGERVPTGDASVAGIRYTFLANGKSLEFRFDSSEQLTRQLAAMGGVTKLGNVVNSIVNADDYDGSDPMIAAAEWLEDAINGEWREPGVARGPKYDDDILAAVIFAELTKTGAAKGDLLHYRERLNDKKYRAGATKFFRDAYEAEAIARGLTVAPKKAVGDFA